MVIVINDVWQVPESQVVVVTIVTSVVKEEDAIVDVEIIGKPDDVSVKLVEYDIVVTSDDVVSVKLLNKTDVEVDSWLDVVNEVTKREVAEEVISEKVIGAEVVGVICVAVVYSFEEVDKVGENVEVVIKGQYVVVVVMTEMLQVPRVQKVVVTVVTLVVKEE